MRECACVLGLVHMHACSILLSAMLAYGIAVGRI